MEGFIMIGENYEGNLADTVRAFCPPGTRIQVGGIASYNPDKVVVAQKVDDAGCIHCEFERCDGMKICLDPAKDKFFVIKEKEG